MPLLYITGPTGVGKTTVCRELCKQGYEAYDSDEGISSHVSRKNGQKVPYPSPENVTLEWIAGHRYEMSERKIQRLRELSGNEPIFICGTADNDLDLMPYFIRAVCLVVDKQTAKRRVETRKTNFYGKIPPEMHVIMNNHDFVIEKYRDAGCELINSTMPLAKIINSILRQAYSH